MTVQPIAEKTAGVLGAAFLLGAPLVLARIGWPLEAGEPGWPVVLMHLRAFTLPTPLLLACLVVVVSAAWSAYALAALADLVCVVRGQAPRLALWRLAAALLAATATGSAVASPAAAAEMPVPAAAAAPNAAHADSSEQKRPPEAIERHRTVAGFALDSARLDADMRGSLDSAAELIGAYGDAEEPIVVTGHTDPTGGDDYNRRLSRRRAEAAAAYLRAALGEEFSFTVEGAGEGAARPRADSAVPYGDLRRVEIDYRLQPPPAPATIKPAEEASDTAADHGKSAPVAQGREETDTGLAQAAVVAVAGTAVLAGGYALARRSRRSHLPKDGSSAAMPQEDGAVPAEAADGDEAPTSSVPVGAETTESPHHVRLGPEVVVDAARGLAITGPGAAGIAAALLTRAAREAPGSVIATRAALTQLGAEDATLPRVTRVNGIEAALVRAEAHLVAAQRATDEGAEEVAAIALPTVLLEGHGEGPTYERVRAVLAAESLTTPIVITLADLGQGTHVHADHERARITDTDGTVRDLPSDAVWREDPAAAEEPPPPAGELPEPVQAPPALPDSGTDAPPQQPGTGQAAVVLRLFAPRLSVEVGGAAVAEGMRAAARLLLAYLAIHPGGATGEEIGELLAPNASPPRARSARNNAVSSARSAIRTALGTEDTPVIEAVDGRYRLHKELFDVDLWHFDDALARARTTTGDSCAHNRRTALGHYSGELLSDISDAWVETERHRCRRSAAQTCVRLAENTAGVEGKVSWLERSCAIDSYNEIVHRMLVEAYAENSDPDAIHRTYERLRANLRGIGERPTKELRVLVERHTSVAPLRAGAPR